MRLVLAALLLACSAGLAGADPVAINPTGDASGDYAAVSGTGHASGYFVAASGTGDADAWDLAVSGAGDARACGGDYTCLAASGLGDARGFAAVSGTGDTQGVAVISLTGKCNAYACNDVALEGDAQAWWVAVSPHGHAAGNLSAVTLDGTAEGAWVVAPLGDVTDAGYGASATGDVRADVLALSLLGDAHGCTAFACPGIAASGTGDADGVVALSLTGHAQGSQLSLSGCDELGACA